MASKGKADENGTGKRVNEQGDGLRRRNVNTSMLCTDDLSVDNVMKMTFDSNEDANGFYMMCSKCIGFSWQEKEDTERNHKAETRVQCGPCFRIKYDVKQGNYEMGKYFLGKYDRPELTWTVELTKNSELIGCSCMKRESKGLPCSYIFRCMVMEHMQSIPNPCILKRCTHSVRNRRNTGCKISEILSEMARYSMQSGLYGIMCYHASKSAEQTNYLKGVIEKEIKQLKAGNSCPSKEQGL
ncbi:hypothetical protein M9H77_35322 [Catharanthus roseus]|uniref:Uncharacterized protein n=1 Tax=Catharanthus roseus TaxID=4058 RepID=A0ACB9ZQU7_CATRO|nr:hypothetical protein M9H77_35322 [Catharanthus roseus]